MPKFQAWKDLASETFRSLDREDVAGLYGREWPAAQSKLVAEFREEIESARGRVRRFLRTVGAVLFGLTRRLAPARRLLLAGAFACIVFSFLGAFNFSYHRGGKEGYSIVVDFSGVAVMAAFVLVLLLLGMELVDKIHFRNELVLARELQADLLPKELPRVPGFELAAFNRIANLVGGDLYDFAPLPDGRLAVLFGDASGHGMTAGLVMAVAHAAFRTQLDVDASPAAIFTMLNRILCRIGGPRSFFACAYLVIAPGGEFTLLLAGHPPILRVSGRGEVIERIGEGAYPLGIKIVQRWVPIDGKLAAGETLLFHSDGLSEARDERGNEFGDARVEIAVHRAGGFPVQTLVDTLASDVSGFCGRVAPEDDISITAVRLESAR